MEINKCTSAVNMYKKIDTGYKSTAKTNARTALNTVRNVDTLEISSSARANSIESAKAAVRNSVSKDASADRIAALKAKIADGSYRVSPESVATAIFEG